MTVSQPQRIRQYRGRTITVRADRLRTGQTVVATPYGPIRPCCDGTQRCDWPAVTHAAYCEDAPDGPTVYLELSDHPGAVFPLRPDEHVKVAA